MSEDMKAVKGADVDKLLDELALSRADDASCMQCKVCWYVYDPKEGCPEWNIPPGTPFRELPEDFTCPDCGHPKTAFLPMPDDEVPA